MTDHCKHCKTTVRPLLRFLVNSAQTPKWPPNPFSVVVGGGSSSSSSSIVALLRILRKYVDVKIGVDDANLKLA
jgi:hypothetical protein